jgi:hypothetical protein
MRFSRSFHKAQAVEIFLQPWPVIHAIGAPGEEWTAGKLARRPQREFPDAGVEQEKPNFCR